MIKMYHLNMVKLTNTGRLKKVKTPCVLVILPHAHMAICRGRFFDFIGKFWDDCRTKRGTRIWSQTGANLGQKAAKVHFPFHLFGCFFVFLSMLYSTFSSRRHGVSNGSFRFVRTHELMFLTFFSASKIVVFGHRTHIFWIFCYVLYYKAYLYPSFKHT